ncbi:MAG: hypothetical protein JWP47_2650 [Polaromonas sp.]|nr:hypothetical protein [Polaromonas sp.]
MTVYKKTHKGMEELLARSPSIDGRLFSVLVLVDGIRDSAEIRQLAQQADLPLDALDILLHGGFLEQRYKGSPTPVRIINDSPPDVPSKPAQLPDDQAQFRGFNDLYAYLVSQTKSLLGLRGFIFQLQIERASTVEGLEALIGPLSEAIAKKHGFEMTQVFKRDSERMVRAALAERRHFQTQSQDRNT